MELTNLSTPLIARLAPPLREAANALVALSNWPVYAVGGAVRDLLLGLPLRDLDVVVEGDGVALARQLGGALGLRPRLHERFGTAALSTSDGVIDIAMARSESYPAPARLPIVQPAPLETDLARRDFTINAMAVPLRPPGGLIDPLEGQRDLDARLIRALHARSFIDDPTRAFRAVRYAKRLGFDLEERTGSWLEGSREFIGLLTGDRLRAEFFAILREERPGEMLLAARDRGLLAPLGLELTLDPPALAALARLPHEADADDPSVVACAILAVGLAPHAARQLAMRIGLPGRQRDAVLATPGARQACAAIAREDIRPSEVVASLTGIPAATLWAVALTTPSPLVRARITDYLQSWRGFRPATPAAELMELGLRGPAIREWLDRLRDARIDGEITAAGERSWLEARTGATARPGDDTLGR